MSPHDNLTQFTRPQRNDPPALRFQALHYIAQRLINNVRPVRIFLEHFGHGTLASSDFFRQTFVSGMTFFYKPVDKERRFNAPVRSASAHCKRESKPLRSVKTAPHFEKGAIN